MLKLADVAYVTSIALSIIMIAFSITIALKVLSGSIRTAGMMATVPNGQTDPERVLLMVATILGGGAYFAYGLREGIPTDTLPPIPEEFLTAMAGGNILYLSGKIFRKGT